MPVPEDRRRHLDPLALCPLDGVAAVVDLRLDVLDLDPAWGVRSVRGSGMRSLSQIDCDPETAMNLPRSSGVLLHPTSLPGGRLGPRGAARSSTGSRRRAQSWWQVLPLGPPDEFDSPVQGRVGVRRLARAAGRPRGGGRGGRAGARSSPRHPTWIGDWAAFAGERRGRRPGALRARVGRAQARTRTSAASGSIGDLPIYVAENGADHLAQPELFAPTSSPACRPTPSPTRASAGATRSTTGRRCARRATAGGSSASAGRSSSTTSCASTTSAASSPTGPCPAESDTAQGGVWRPRAGPRALRRRRRELGALPLIAEDLGVITEPVVAAPRRARPPRDARAPVRLRRASGQPAPAGSAPRERRRLHRHARQRHGRAAGGTRSARTTRRCDRARPGATRRWSLVELAYASPARLAVVPGAGPARARQRGADERPRPEQGQLALAARGRAAHRRARGACPRGDAGRRPVGVGEPMVPPRAPSFCLSGFEWRGCGLPGG